MSTLLGRAVTSSMRSSNQADTVVCKVFDSVIANRLADVPPDLASSQLKTAQLPVAHAKVLLVKQVIAQHDA